MYNAVEFHMPARDRIRGHHHPQWHVLFLTDGGFEEACGGHSFHMTQETLRVSPPAAIHNIDVCEQGAQCINIHICDQRLVRRLSSLAPDQTGIYRHAGARALFARAVDQSRQLETRPLSVLTLQEGIARLSMAHRGDWEPDPPDWLREIDGQIRSRSIAMRRIFDIAAHYGLTREHVTRTYVRYLGSSPAFARSQVVVSEALNRILNSDAPYAEIAADLGYHDQSHMTHAVRRAVGETPHVLRTLRRSQIYKTTLEFAAM